MPTNSALLTREHVLPDWLKSGFLATFVLVACWGGTIAYWRTTGSNPQTRELLLFLFGLPACLLLVFFGGRKLFTQATPAPAAVPLSTPAKAAAASSRNAPLAIVAASLRLPHGASPEELASAIAGNKARADLDKELLDDEGFPVMTARSNEAVDEVQQEEIAEWLALNGMAEVQFSDEQWRAVTLASTVVAELAAQAVGPMLYQVDPQAKPQLIPIVPIEWDALHRHAASMWLKQTVARYGWPADRIMLSTDDLTPSAAFKRLGQDAASANGPLIAMVVACASHIGDDTIARWAADGSLFSASQPQGRIPGEGAVGVVVTNQANLADAPTVALLDGIEEAKRNTSADEAKRSDPDIFKELMERALGHSTIKASDVAMLIADTGHRSSRVLELMGHLSAGLPQLDEADDVVRVGVASGSCGAVPFMAALALGRHYAVERGAPVLCVSNEDPYHRAVTLVRSSESLPKA
jgi:hypothetical protein